MTSFKKQLLFTAALSFSFVLLSSNSFLANKNPVPVLLTDTSHPKDCSIAEYLFDSSMVSAGVHVFTYYKDTGVIKDVLYQDDDGLGCVADSTTKCDDTNKHETDETALRYRAFYPIGTDSLPDGHNYNARPLPAIIFFHAGGFKECT